MNEFIVGHISDFKERRGKVLKLDTVEIALFKLSDGSVKAVENSCPHKQGKLSEGMVCDHHVYCPLHDWKIDLNDGLVQDPDVGCVKTFQVHVDDKGNVIMRIDGTEAMVS